MGREQPTFETEDTGVSGRNRGIGTGEDEQMPERETGNPNAASGFLDVGEDEQVGETTLPESEREELREG